MLGSGLNCCNLGLVGENGHGGCRLAGAGFEKVVPLGAIFQSGGDFGGGGEARAAVRGDFGTSGIKGEGADDGGVELHGCTMLDLEPVTLVFEFCS